MSLFGKITSLLLFTWACGTDTWTILMADDDWEWLGLEPPPLLPPLPLPFKAGLSPAPMLCGSLSPDPSLVSTKSMIPQAKNQSVNAHTEKIQLVNITIHIGNQHSGDITATTLLDILRKHGIMYSQRTLEPFCRRTNTVYCFVCARFFSPGTTTSTLKVNSSTTEIGNKMWTSGVGQLMLMEVKGVVKSTTAVYNNSCRTTARKEHAGSGEKGDREAGNWDTYVTHWRHPLTHTALPPYYSPPARLLPTPLTRAKTFSNHQRANQGFLRSTNLSFLYTAGTLKFFQHFKAPLYALHNIKLNNANLTRLIEPLMFVDRWLNR